MIKVMNAPKERILVVESDAAVSDLIARQCLIPMGYKVEVVGSAASAIQSAINFSPDLIIAALNLPGLSGKDMLVALNAQGIDVPLIVISEHGMEADVIQAFRLGAVDFLSSPLREAEVLSAVERVLKQGRNRREKELLARQLNQTNQELQRRVRELTTIFAIGKAVISITDLRSLFDKIVEGAVYITESDVGWLLSRDERSKSYILSAHRNLPKSIAAYMNQPWDDGLSSLVALSGETLSIHGDPLKRFKVASLGQSALVVPVKLRNEVVGLLVVVRKAAQPYSGSGQALLEAVADYASIAIVNARLFRALEDRARSFQQAADAAQVGERIGDDVLYKSSRELKAYLADMNNQLEALAGKTGSEKIQVIQSIRRSMQSINELAEAMASIRPVVGTQTRISSDLNELIRQAVTRFQPYAQPSGVTFFTELFPRPVMVEANPFHVAKVIDGLLSNAIKHSPQSGQVTVHVDFTREHMAQLIVKDQGSGIEESKLKKIFEGATQSAVSPRFTGLGIGLKLARDIITAYGGKIWVESKPGAGTTFFVNLPPARQ